jgi:hypothetical protein
MVCRMGREKTWERCVNKKLLNRNCAQPLSHIFVRSNVTKYAPMVAGKRKDPGAEVCFRVWMKSISMSRNHFYCVYQLHFFSLHIENGLVTFLTLYLTSTYQSAYTAMKKRLLQGTTFSYADFSVVCQPAALRMRLIYRVFLLLSNCPPFKCGLNVRFLRCQLT